MDRELRLNSVDRYVKSSPQFVLEEHSHCEVPAGCGGVVLQWRNPQMAVPVRIQVAATGADGFRFHVDGARPASSRPQLRPGAHVLMVVAENVVAGTFAWLFAARAAPRSGSLLLSTPGNDGDWRWTADEPPAGAWTDPGFDNASWAAMPAGAVGEDVSFSVRRLTSDGHGPLTVPVSARRVWIRAVLTVPAK